MASIFISYSHKDETFKEQLEAHLSALKNQGLIDAWHDRRIKAGDDFDSAISAELNKADVILLLVSPDFLASRYICDVEIARAMQRQKAGDARVVPVILRHCDWKGTPFERLKAAPRDGRPIKAWPDTDEAFLDVVNLIRDALPSPEEIAAKRRIADVEQSRAKPSDGGTIVRRRLAFKVKPPYQDQFIYPFKNFDRITIGRSRDNDLIIEDDLTVSRYHCVAVILPDSIRIEDRGSTNLPIINGVETRTGELKLYEKLELGDTELVLIPEG